MPSSDAQQWLEKAYEDEQVIALVKAAKGPWSMAAYHIQQAAEKYIKAGLVQAEVAPPKTHDLVHLLTLFPGAQPEDTVTIAAAMTSAYAWLTRYPGAASFDEQDVLQAEQDLQIIKKWILTVL